MPQLSYTPSPTLLGRAYGSIRSTTLLVPVGHAAVPVGVAVAADANGDLRRLAATDLISDIVGIVCLDNSTVLIPLGGYALTADEYTEGQAAYVVSGAQAFDLAPEVNVAVGDPIFVRIVAAGPEVFGAFRNDADTADAIQLPGSWRKAGLAGVPTRAEIYLP